MSYLTLNFLTASHGWTGHKI